MSHAYVRMERATLTTARAPESASSDEPLPTDWERQGPDSSHLAMASRLELVPRWKHRCRYSLVASHLCCGMVIGAPRRRMRWQACDLFAGPFFR